MNPMQRQFLLAWLVSVAAIFGTTRAVGAEETILALRRADNDSLNARIEHVRKHLERLQANEHDANRNESIHRVEDEVRRNLINTLDTLGATDVSVADAQTQTYQSLAPADSEYGPQIVAEKTETDPAPESKRSDQGIDAKERKVEEHEVRHAPPRGPRVEREPVPRWRGQPEADPPRGWDGPRPTPRAERAHSPPGPERHLADAAWHLESAGYERLARQVRHELERLHDERRARRAPPRPDALPTELERRLDELSHRLEQFGERLGRHDLEDSRRTNSDRRPRAPHSDARPDRAAPSRETREHPAEAEIAGRMEALMRQRHEEARQREEALHKQQRQLDETRQQLQRQFDEARRQRETQRAGFHQHFDRAHRELARRVDEAIKRTEQAASEHRQIQQQLKLMARQVVEERTHRAQSVQRLARALAESERKLADELRELKERLGKRTDRQPRDSPGRDRPERAPSDDSQSVR